jgi:hypothetical protein
MRIDEADKNYQFRRISGRLEIEVINAKPVFGNIKFLGMCPVVN